MLKISMYCTRSSGFLQHWYRVPLRKCYECYKTVAVNRYCTPLTSLFLFNTIHIIVLNNEAAHLMIDQGRGLAYDHI